MEEDRNGTAFESLCKDIYKIENKFYDIFSSVSLLEKRVDLLSDAMVDLTKNMNILVDALKEEKDETQ